MTEVTDEQIAQEQDRRIDTGVNTAEDRATRKAKKGNGAAAPDAAAGVPEHFPPAVTEALAKVGTGAYGVQAPAAAPTLPEAPFSVTFKLAQKGGYDALVTTRAATAKGLAAHFGELLSYFLPVAEEFGFVMPGVTEIAPPENVTPYPGQPAAYTGQPSPYGGGNPDTGPDPDGNNFSQPAGFPRPVNAPAPAPAPQAPAWPPQPAAPGYPPQAPGYPPQGQAYPPAAPTGNGGGGQRGSFPLMRLAVATTRNGGVQLQAFGPTGEKATSSLRADILAAKCAPLGLTAGHFQQPGIELYNAAMPGAPQGVAVEWYQKDGSRYKDLDKLVIMAR